VLVPDGLDNQLDALDELGRLSEAAIAERRNDEIGAIFADIRQVLAAIAWSLEEVDEAERMTATERILGFERENLRRQEMLVARRDALGREIAQVKRVRRLLVQRLRERGTQSSILDLRR